MDPIKNVGTNDYTMAIPQQQNEVQQTPEEDYSSMPMIYDPEVEDKKKASSNMLGMTALGALALGGLAYGAVKKHQAGKLDTKIKDLTKEKETIQTELNEVKNKLTELENKKPEENKTVWQKIKGWFKKDKKADEKKDVKPAEGETKTETKTESAENTEKNENAK